MGNEKGVVVMRWILMFWMVDPGSRTTLLLLFPCLSSTCLPDIWWDIGQGGQDQAKKREAFVGYLKLLPTALEMDALAAEAVVRVRETSCPIDRINGEFVQAKAREDGDDKRALKAGRMEVQPSAQGSAMAKRSVKPSIESIPESLEHRANLRGFCSLTIFKRHYLVSSGRYSIQHTREGNTRPCRVISKPNKPTSHHPNVAERHM